MDFQQVTLVFKLKETGDFSDIKIESHYRNFVADLTNVSEEVINKVKNKFVTFDESISKMKGSFVIVSDYIFDETLNIVPTLQEAYDLIEIEEIERELN